MNTIYYIRDFSAKLGLADISPMERLLLSCAVTKYINKDKRDSVEILFSLQDKFENDAYRRWKCYEDYVKEQDKMIQSCHAHFFDDVIKQAAENLNDLHVVKVDLSKLNLDGRSSLTCIAFKAFVIAASMHTCNDDIDWFDIPYFMWTNTRTHTRKRIYSEIAKWLAENKIYCQLIGKNIHILNKKKQKDLLGLNKTNYLEGFEG